MEASVERPHSNVLDRMWAVLETRPVLVIFLIALAVRAVIVLAASSYFSSRGLILDDATYNFMATDMAAGTTGDWDEFTHSLFWRTAAFLGPVTLIYKLFGPVKEIAQLFVALLGAGTAALTFKLAAELVSRRLAIGAGLAIALIPSQAFWSSMLMKDAAVWIVLVATAVLVAVAGRSTGRKLLLSGIGVALMLGILAFLREHTLVVAAWAVMVAAFFGSRLQRPQRIAGALAIGICIPWFAANIGPAGLILVTDSGSLAERRFQNAVGANTALVDTTPSGTQEELDEVNGELGAVGEEIDAISAGDFEGTREQSESRLAELRAEQARLLERKANLQTPIGGDEGALDPSIRHLPRGLSVMLIEPFPVPFTGSLSLRLAKAESLLWYPLLVVAAIGLWVARRHLRVLAFPMLAGAGILLMYALAEGNVGTAHRHRGEFVWVVVILATLGISHLAGRRRLLDASST